MDPAERELLDRHLNGDLDAAEEATFLVRIGRSPELRRALAERALEDALLSEVVREGRIPARRPSRRRWSWPAAGAAALMLGALALLLFPARRSTELPRASDGSNVPHEGDSTASAGRSKVDLAIRLGCRYLESRRADLFVPLEDGQRYDPAPRRIYAELAALALHRSGHSPENPELLEEWIGRGLARPLESTYLASIRATLLAERGLHPDRLRECAQFLVDSQCQNGQWDYGRAIPLGDVPASGLIRRRRDGPPSGDNSVSAYAVSGLLAVHRAGVALDPGVLERARSWWLECQNADGGWGYRDRRQPDRPEIDARRLTSDWSYGSATASGISSLAALREMMGADRAVDQALGRGVQWLAANFSVESNPRKAAGFCQVHWLLGSARAGKLLGTDRFGSHDWYALGTAFLLDRQKPTGEWSLEGEFMKGEMNSIVDTCLAVLFLSSRR